MPIQKVLCDSRLWGSWYEASRLSQVGPQKWGLAGLAPSSHMTTSCDQALIQKGCFMISVISDVEPRDMLAPSFM
jgi:hypothetical protein